jgi:hypothetical protein
VTFLQDLTDGSAGCSSRGVLVLARGDGTKLRISTEVVAGSVGFAHTGVLLYEVQRECTAGRAELMAYTPGSVGAISLGAEYEPFYPWMSRYPISPDGRLLLAIRVGSMDNTAELAVLRVDGGGSSTLVTDLFPPYLTCMAFEPAAFGGEGQFVAYISAQGEYPKMGLSAVPTAGGTPVRLAAQIFSAQFAASARSEEVAFIELSDPGKRSLVVASLRTGARTATWRAPPEGGGGPSSLRFTPDGRGLLFTNDTSNQGSELRYLSARDGSGKTLAKWKQTTLQPTYPERGPFVIDPQGCVVLYDTDDGDAAGTYLALLPE